MTDIGARDIAIVSGGASGLGRAVGQRLAERGAKVLLLDVHEDAGQAAALAIGAEFIACDVSSRGDWARVRAHVAANLGTPSLISFNAGVMTRPASAPLGDDPFAWIEKGGYARAFDVNVHGISYGLEALLPLMGDSGGAVVATVSIAGLMPTPFDPFYAASKHAAIGLVRSVGPLLKRRRIRVNAFCPGPIATPLMPHEFLERTRSAMRPLDAADSILAIMMSSGTAEAWVRMTPDAPAVRFEFPALAG